MPNIQNCVKQLEKVSLLTCSNDVLQLLERALKNVEPILKIDGRRVKPLLWQNELDWGRMNDGVPKPKLGVKDLEKNAKTFYEDYVAVGIPPRKK